MKPFSKVETGRGYCSIVDKIFGTVSSRTDGNSTVTVDSLGASNDENNLGN